MTSLPKLIFTVLLLATGVLWAKEPIYTGSFSNAAIGGYDAVSYHAEGKEPIKGSKQHKLEWRGATWLFDSERNLKAFQAEPERYAPQYGGYCAWAIAQGKLAKGDPKVFTLLDGKLYLNYSKRIDAAWQKDRQNFIKQADKAYPTLVELGE